MKQLTTIILFLPIALLGQKTELIDKVIGVVGKEVVLYSDLETAALELSQGKGMSTEEKCTVLENLLFQKLLLNQAKLDSVVVTEGEIQSQIEQRLQYFIGMFGSAEEFEKYYGKSVAEWKSEFHDDISDQILIQRKRAELTDAVTVTPAQVTSYLNAIPTDSLPLINAQIEYAQIILRPSVDEAEENRVRNFLDSIRTDVMNGKTSMLLQAAKWSEDPGSKNKGGCYPLQRKGSFVPEYEAAVDNTPEGGFSPVFESEFGFHFVKVVEKRGDYYESCHILMSPKVSQEDLDQSRILLDSLLTKVKKGQISFADAAMKYSTDELSKNQEGRVINPETGGTKHDVGQIPPNVFFILDKLKTGELSEPVLIDNIDGSQSYGAYMLISRTEAHRANLKDDYLLFKDQAEQEVQQEAIEKWMNKIIKTTYIQVDEMYAGCAFEHKWLTNQP